MRGPSTEDEFERTIKGGGGGGAKKDIGTERYPGSLITDRVL